jgi:hypothetical protein
MQALAASCEELHARTGNPPLLDFANFPFLVLGQPRWSFGNYQRISSCLTYTTPHSKDHSQPSQISIILLPSNSSYIVNLSLSHILLIKFVSGKRGILSIHTYIFIYIQEKFCSQIWYVQF